MNGLIKNIFSLLLLLSFSYSEELSLGSDIPMNDVKMIDISGKEVSLSDIKKANGLLVAFSCNTCPWVLNWQDRYNRIAQESEANEIGFVTLNPNERTRDQGESLSDMRKFSKKYKHDFLYLEDKDSRLAKAFGATKTPHVYLFNGEGKLVYRGAIDDNARKSKKVKKAYLMDAIYAVGNRKPVRMKETKALGCGIKFAEK